MFGKQFWEVNDMALFRKKAKKEAAAAKKKVTPKINYTKLAQNSGYTDSAEIERFKKGGEKGVKAAQDGKSAVVPKFSNPYK